MYLVLVWFGLNTQQRIPNKVRLALLNHRLLNALQRGAAGDDLTSYERHDEHGRHNQDDRWRGRTV